MVGQVSQRCTEQSIGCFQGSDNTREPGNPRFCGAGRYEHANPAHASQAEPGRKGTREIARPRIPDGEVLAT
jgi:hypothetical protein